MIELVTNFNKEYIHNNSAEFYDKLKNGMYHKFLMFIIETRKEAVNSIKNLKDKGYEVKIKANLSINREEATKYLLSETENKIGVSKCFVTNNIKVIEYSLSSSFKSSFLIIQSFNLNDKDYELKESVDVDKITYDYGVKNFMSEAESNLFHQHVNENDSKLSINKEGSM